MTNDSLNPISLLKRWLALIERQNPSPHDTMVFTVNPNYELIPQTREAIRQHFAAPDVVAAWAELEKSNVIYEGMQYAFQNYNREAQKEITRALTAKNTRLIQIEEEQPEPCPKCTPAPNGYRETMQKIVQWLKDFNEQNEDDAGLSFFDAQEKAENLAAILETAPSPTKRESGVGRRLLANAILTEIKQFRSGEMDGGGALARIEKLATNANGSYGASE